MPASTSTILGLAANVFGATFVAFGINAILRPEHALSFFHFADLRTPGDQKLIDYLMIVYGVRDVFMGAAIWLTLYFGSRKALGGVLVGCGGVAFVDGVVCKLHGFGEWDHWGYAPMVAAVGLVSFGILD